MLECVMYCIPSLDLGRHYLLDASIRFKWDSNGIIASHATFLPQTIRIRVENGSLKACPPNKDLAADECERAVVALLLEGIIVPKVVWTAYTAVVYLELGNNGHRLAASKAPEVVVQFPKRGRQQLKNTPKPPPVARADTPKDTTKSRSKKSTTNKPTKKSTQKKGKPATKGKVTRKARKTKAKAKPPSKPAIAKSTKKTKVLTKKRDKPAPAVVSDEIIEIDSDSDEEPLVTLVKKSPRILYDDYEDDDDDYEGSSREAEFD